MLLYMPKVLENISPINRSSVRLIAISLSRNPNFKRHYKFLKEMDFSVAIYQSN